MAIKKILRFILILVTAVIAAVLLFFIIGVAPIDRSPDRSELYQKMMEGLDEVSLGGIEMIETRSA